MKKNNVKIKSNKLPDEVKRAIIIVIVFVLLLVAMYFLTTKILESDNEDNKVTENAIQYNEILAGSSFNQSEEDYYVIYYDRSDEYSNYESLISSYQLNSMGTKLYSVDLSSGMNKKYLTEGNIVTKSANELRVKATTLLRFKDNKVTEVITDTNKIIEFLNSN